MKKAVVFVLALVLAVSFSGICFAAGGKVAIVTLPSQDAEEYISAMEMIAKYGSDRVILAEWPAEFTKEQAEMIKVVERLGADPDVKAIIMNQALQGSNAAINNLRKTRKDILVISCVPAEDPPEVSTCVDIALDPNTPGMAKAIGDQAKALGAKTFVFYSFPRHMNIPGIQKMSDIIKEKCVAAGIQYVNATGQDPMEAGLNEAREFVMEDIPKIIAKYGKDTAFYATNCGLQLPLIKSVVNGGALYPQPCCPSPYHGFPEALGIESDPQKPDNLQRVIDETRKILKEKGVAGRISTWPVPMTMMFTAGATEYAMRMINGEAGLRTLDADVMTKCLSNYAKVDVALAPYAEDGKEYANFLTIVMGYMTY